MDPFGPRMLCRARCAFRSGSPVNELATCPSSEHFSTAFAGAGSTAGGCSTGCCAAASKGTKRRAMRRPFMRGSSDRVYDAQAARVLSQPLIQVLAHELVIVQMWIGRVNAV